LMDAALADVKRRVKAMLMNFIFEILLRICKSMISKTIDLLL
jgi:hypothetical protein